MKKLEGILTLCGVVLIIGLPMFLMLTGFNSDSQVFCENYINIISYGDSIGTAFSDFEQSYPALDGSESRDEIVYLYNESDLINDSIVSISDSIPLGIDNEIGEKIDVSDDTSSSEVCLNQSSNYIYIEPVLLVACDLDTNDIIDDTIVASDDKLDVIVIDITEDVPLALAASSVCSEETTISYENFVFAEEFSNSQDELEEVIDISDAVPEGLIEYTDSAAGDSISINTETISSPIEEVFYDVASETFEIEDIEINDEIPQGINEMALPEDFEDTDEQLILCDEEVPEGLSTDSYEPTEVRTEVITIDENGTQYEAYTQFLY